MNIALKDIRKKLTGIEDETLRTNERLSELTSLVRTVVDFLLEVTVSEANDIIEELSEDGSTSG